LGLCGENVRLLSLVEATGELIVLRNSSPKVSSVPGISVLMDFYMIPMPFAVWSESIERALFTS